MKTPTTKTLSAGNYLVTAPDGRKFDLVYVAETKGWHAASQGNKWAADWYPTKRAALNHIARTWSDVDAW